MTKRALVQTSFLDYLRSGEIKRLVFRFGDELTKRKMDAVSVISLEGGEGRSLLVAVLAVGVATFLKKKVLIVDTSSQPQNGKLYLQRILNDAEVGKCVDLITPRADETQGDGAADFELMGLLKHYREIYDLVLFDTSAIQSSHRNTMDPIIVSKTAGCAVMIVSKGTLGSVAFKKIRDDLKDWEIPVLGTVYNFVGTTGSRQRAGE